MCVHFASFIVAKAHWQLQTASTFFLVLIIPHDSVTGTVLKKIPVHQEYTSGLR
jgi:hypothetical protein